MSNSLKGDLYLNGYQEIKTHMIPKRVLTNPKEIISHRNYTPLNPNDEDSPKSPTAFEIDL